MTKRIFFISPVRKLTPEIEEELLKHTKKLENDGYEVHLPFRDTPQNLSGLNILNYNLCKIQYADEVHIYYLEDSSGSKFDFGATMALRKPLVIVNDVERRGCKCFGNAILDYEKNRNVEKPTPPNPRLIREDGKEM